MGSVSPLKSGWGCVAHRPCRYGCQHLREEHKGFFTFWYCGMNGGKLVGYDTPDGLVDPNGCSNWSDGEWDTRAVA